MNNNYINKHKDQIKAVIWKTARQTDVTAGYYRGTYFKSVVNQNWQIKFFLINLVKL